MTRYLRIAAAGFFALLTVALIGLWVRSYYRVDVATAPLGESGTMLLGSHAGGIMLDWTASDSLSAKAAWEFQVEGNYYLARDVLGFRLIRTSSAVELIVPNWFLAASSLALAALFAFKRNWRFTIRTLLIATTLVAIALGLGVYLL